MRDQVTQLALPTGAWSSDGALRGSAAVGSVEVKDPNLAAHLQAPDFFDAEHDPAHEHLDEAGHPMDPAQEEALHDSVVVVLGELQNVGVAA